MQEYRVIYLIQNKISLIINYFIIRVRNLQNNQKQTKPG